MCCVWNSIGLGQPGCKSTALSPETPARATRACSEIVPGRLSVAGTPPDMSDGLLAFRTSPVLRGGGQVPTRGGATQIYSIQINFHLQQIVKSNMLSYSSIIFEFVGAFK